MATDLEVHETTGRRIAPIQFIDRAGPSFLDMRGSKGTPTVPVITLPIVPAGLTVRPRAGWTAPRVKVSIKAPLLSGSCVIVAKSADQTKLHVSGDDTTYGEKATLTLSGTATKNFWVKPLYTPTAAESVSSVGGAAEVTLNIYNREENVILASAKVWILRCVAVPIKVHRPKIRGGAAGTFAQTSVNIDSALLKAQAIWWQAGVVLNGFFNIADGAIEYCPTCEAGFTFATDGTVSSAETGTLLSNHPTAGFLNVYWVDKLGAPGNYIGGQSFQAAMNARDAATIGADPAGSRGIICGGQAIQEQSSFRSQAFEDSARFNGKLLAHEMGHSLALFHPPRTTTAANIERRTLWSRRLLMTNYFNVSYWSTYPWANTRLCQLNGTLLDDYNDGANTYDQAMQGDLITAKNLGSRNGKVVSGQHCDEQVRYSRTYAGLALY